MCPHCHHRTHLSPSETPTPLEHCACPDDSLWPLLTASRFGKQLRLSSAQRRFKTSLRRGEVAYYNPPEPGVPAHASGTWGSLPADTWHNYIVNTWDEIAA